MTLAPVRPDGGSSGARAEEAPGSREPDPQAVPALTGSDPSRNPDLQPVFDLIIEACQYTPFHTRGAKALRFIDQLATENSGLRITLWNVLRSAGVAQDMAIRIIREAAAGASDSDRSGEAGETQRGSTVGESAGRTSGIAQEPRAQPQSKEPT